MNILASMIFDVHSHIKKPGTIQILQSNDRVLNDSFYSAGIHPWEAAHFKSQINNVFQLAENENCLAIGECGLDKLTGPSLTIQQEAFEAQILLSEQLQLPVIIHCVRSFSEIVQVRKNLKPKQPWVFHGFNKTSLLGKLISEDMMISIGSSILKNPSLQECLDQIPNQHLLFETDNADIEIKAIYQKAAALKQLTLQELESIVEQNFKRTFKKWTIGSKEQNCY
jgi:TatD DNase family protein